MPSDTDLEERQKLLYQLAERAVRLRRAASSDRERAWEEYSRGTEISRFVQGTLEVDGDLIEQIAQDLSIDRISKMNIDRAMEILHGNRWFDWPYVADWYFQDNGYEALKAYIELLDYIRLECLEYLNIYLENEA